MVTERFIESLDKANTALQIADHMTYITYPLIKDKRLLLKVLDELNISIINIINAILQYEYMYKRINIYNSAKENFRTFKEKCAPAYKITGEQVSKVLEIISLAERHKESSFEFVKNEKIVIMSNNSHLNVLTTEKVKDFLLEVKDVLRKANLRIKH